MNAGASIFARSYYITNRKKPSKFCLKELFIYALNQRHQDYAGLFPKVIDPVHCTTKKSQQNAALIEK